MRTNPVVIKRKTSLSQRVEGTDGQQQQLNDGHVRLFGPCVEIERDSPTSLVAWGRCRRTFVQTPHDIRKKPSQMSRNIRLMSWLSVHQSDQGKQGRRYSDPDFDGSIRPDAGWHVSSWKPLFLLPPFNVCDDYLNVRLWRLFAIVTDLMETNAKWTSFVKNSVKNQGLVVKIPKFYSKWHSIWTCIG